MCLYRSRDGCLPYERPLCARSCHSPAPINDQFRRRSDSSQLDQKTREHRKGFLKNLRRSDQHTSHRRTRSSRKPLERSFIVALAVRLRASNKGGNFDLVAPQTAAAGKQAALSIEGRAAPGAGLRSMFTNLGG